MVFCFPSGKGLCFYHAYFHFRKKAMQGKQQFTISQHTTRLPLFISILKAKILFCNWFIPKPLSYPLSHYEKRFLCNMCLYILRPSQYSKYQPPCFPLPPNNKSHSQITLWINNGQGTGFYSRSGDVNSRSHKH